MLVVIFSDGPDKMAASTTMPKGKYTESLTFGSPNCIYANYGKLGKPSLHPTVVDCCLLTFHQDVTAQGNPCSAC